MHNDVHNNLSGDRSEGGERLVTRLAALIEARANVIAQVETVNNGMPLWLESNIVLAERLQTVKRA